MGTSQRARMSVATRPVGVTVLAILGGLVTIGQLVAALRLLGLLPFVETGGGRSIGHWIGAGLYVLIAMLNIRIVHGLWVLRPDARGQVIVSTVINGTLALLAMLSPATFWQSLPALAINIAFFVYCRSEGVRQAFGKA